MDNIIINHVDFSHNDANALEYCQQTLNAWLTQYRSYLQGPDVINALHAFGHKLTQAKSPTWDTHGWYQARFVCDSFIMPTAKDLVKSGKLDKRHYHQALVKLMVTLFHDGPSTIQMHVILQACAEAEEYIKTLQGADMMELLQAACSPIIIKEDSEDKKIRERFKLGVETVLRYTFQQSQLQQPEAFSVLLDLTFHTYLDYSDLEKDSYDHMISLGRRMYEYMRKTWKVYDNVNKIKQLIEKLNTAVKQPGFPQSKGVGGNVRQLAIYVGDNLIKKSGDVETYCTGIFEVLNSLAQCQTRDIDQDDWLFQIFESVTDCFKKQNQDVIQNKQSIFQAVVPGFSFLMETIDIKFLVKTQFALKMAVFFVNVFAKNKKMLPDFLSLTLPLSKRASAHTLRGLYLALRADDTIKWKEYRDTADGIIEAFSNVDLSLGNDGSKDFYANHKDCIDCFVKHMKRCRLLKDYGQRLMLLSIRLLEIKNEKLNNAAEVAMEDIEINIKTEKGSFVNTARRLFELLKDDSLPWLSDFYLYRTVLYMFRQTLCTCSDGKIFTDEEMQLLIDMCAFCLSQDGLNPLDNRVSPYHDIADRILRPLIELLGATKRLSLASKLLPLIFKNYDEDDESLSARQNGYLALICRHDPTPLAPHFAQLVKIFFDSDAKNSQILDVIKTVYPKNPKQLSKHFQKFMAHLLESDVIGPIQMNLFQIFREASMLQPELFTVANMEGLVTLATNSDRNSQLTICQILQELSKRSPEKMVKTMDAMVTSTKWDQDCAYFLNDIVCNLALKIQPVLNRAFNYYMKSVQSLQTKGNVVTCINSLYQLTMKYTNFFKPKRQEIENLKKTVEDPNGLSIVQSILDLIDGNTPENMKKKFEEHQGVVSGLVIKVDEVEETVVAMGDELESQGNQLQRVSSRVTDHDKRLDEVEEVVEETVLKVEEIDNKTLSYAPYWSRDVSKLLNPQAERDWRLLSSRLGYSNDDIRGWAQQADPCMAMLNEWYATRKTSEATLSILTHLQEMNRMDVAVILENAMKNAEAVVEDEEFVYASPPPVFISYQWGHQEEVKLLKKHLEMAGYECWMDIGQMGGGDKLFEKIDSGIRAAKVVISCISNKYTKSPNCNREVNLSVGLHKPVIPLLLEQCPWPPPGSMGPIFSESLFIRFFQRKGEETTDQRYWSEPKFLELLMQLNMNGVPPDEGNIEPTYKNWWMPIEQEIKIDKNRTKTEAQSSPAVKDDTDAKASQCPDVFISYQWGKQKNVVKLYERLTAMGFACWLDIKQMGGGDSLYDKIDRGVRGSKVVLSCVTHKYALSANCRREVSLADALKKPLIPLLLESMTWPPPGPMSMAMTQLLYIGFTQEEQQLLWHGPQFDELISKIDEHVPRKNVLTAEQKDGSQEKQEDLPMVKASIGNVDTLTASSSSHQASDNKHTSTPASQPKMKNENDKQPPHQQVENKNRTAPKISQSLKEQSKVEDTLSTSKKPTQDAKKIQTSLPKSQTLSSTSTTPALETNKNQTSSPTTGQMENNEQASSSTISQTPNQNLDGAQVSSASIHSTRDTATVMDPGSKEHAPMKVKESCEDEPKPVAVVKPLTNQADHPPRPPAVKQENKSKSCSII